MLGNRKKPLPNNLLLGMPVNVRLAFQKKFDNKAMLHWFMNLGEDCVMHEKLEMPVNDNLKCTMMVDTDLVKIFKSPGDAIG